MNKKELLEATFEEENQKDKVMLKDIPAQKVWKAIGQKPLFGHHSGKRSGTFWGCYMKGQI